MQKERFTSKDRERVIKHIEEIHRIRLPTKISDKPKYRMSDEGHVWIVLGSTEDWNRVDYQDVLDYVYDNDEDSAQLVYVIKTSDEYRVYRGPLFDAMDKISLNHRNGFYIDENPSNRKLGLRQTRATMVTVFLDFEVALSRSAP